VQACSAPAGYIANDDDCNDTDASIHPGAPEVCGDTIDQDCNGADAVCPLLAVVFPNGGEVWPIGRTQTIQWQPTGVSGKVRIELSRDNGGLWETLLKNTANDGAQNWKVNGPITTQALIRVCSVLTPAVCDVSDHVFTLGGGSITVTSPNGNEHWAIGSRQTIRWDSNGITGKVKIELSRDNGGSWQILFGAVADNGAKRWKVTGPAANQARIRVSSILDAGAVDTSDEGFSIQ
jgi:hypothetical protein